MVASLERLHWRRLGGSVFRYDGVSQADGTLHEDWLNHIAPSLMFPQSFLIARGITLKFLTVDASSIRFLDHSMPVNQRALAHIIDTFPCGKPQTKTSWSQPLGSLPLPTFQFSHFIMERRQSGLESLWNLDFFVHHAVRS